MRIQFIILVLILILFSCTREIVDDTVTVQKECVRYRLCTLWKRGTFAEEKECLIWTKEDIGINCRLTEDKEYCVHNDYAYTIQCAE